MATITTKFDIGDTVFHARTATTVKSHPCPDCIGSKKWIAQSPAGGSFEVPCIRCASNYQANHRLSLNYSSFEPVARRLTIGSVRADTNSDRSPEYMCVETGVGSGNVYREADLFRTEAEALVAAQAQANVQNTNPDGWVAKQYDETARFSDYELKDAEIEAAKQASSLALIGVRDLLEDLDEAESLEDVRQRIADWREKREAA